jgi:hypothetical protein
MTRRLQQTYGDIINLFVGMNYIDGGCVRTANAGAQHGVARYDSPACFYVLGHRNLDLHGIQSLTEYIALLQQGNLLLDGATDPEEMAHFIESPAEASCRGHASESTRGIVALLAVWITHLVALPSW